jgi:hypothetical protein
MTAWDVINGATNKQVSPNFLYYKIVFEPQEFRKILYYKVDNGFGYLLRYYTAAWYFFNVFGESGTVPAGNAPTIEFYVQRQSRQSDPIPMNLETSQGEYISAALNTPNPADSPIPAEPLKSAKILNYFYQFGDMVEFHVTRDPNLLDTYPVRGLVSQVVHLVLKGYDVPEPQARIW